MKIPSHSSFYHCTLNLHATKILITDALEKKENNSWSVVRVLKSTSDSDCFSKTSNRRSLCFHIFLHRDWHGVVVGVGGMNIEKLSLVTVFVSASYGPSPSSER